MPSKDLMNYELIFFNNKDNKVEHFRYLLHALLPYLKMIDDEQVVDMNMEAKRRRLHALKINEAYEHSNEHLYCGNYNTSIFDFHKTAVFLNVTMTYASHVVGRFESNPCKILGMKYL
ncbi:hypothetical protein EZV62_019923 [Acer yangbiense]|uniref:Uncharacterized protein n=1 Tax=Acer yangbiense TaxID=1000413 RepID=A0A5C7HCP0_9ROSI|nr:hypothetical protein EZV62_019923 [Acer yangbiense]